MNIYSETTLAILVGLTGMLSGLAVKKISNFRRFQNVLIAVVINIVAAYFFSIFKYQGYDSSYAAKVIFWSSVFLIAMMLIFANVARPKQLIMDQSLDTVVSQTSQSLDFTGKAMWFYQIWWIALTKPKEANYLELIESQKTSWLKAYWWVFASGTAGGILGILVTGDFYFDSSNLLVISLIGLILGILSITGFIVDSVVTHVVAQLEGGQGNYTNLVYVLSAINAPLMGINSFLIALGIVKVSSDPAYWLAFLPFLICVGLVYTTVLGIITTKATNKFTILRSAIAAVPYRLILIIVIIVASIYLRQQM